MSEGDKLITRSMDGMGHGRHRGHRLTCESMSEYGAVDISCCEMQIEMNESLFCVCFFFVYLVHACMVVHHSALFVCLRLSFSF